MPILQECYNLDSLKQSINERICKLNENEINSIYYNAMSLEYVLPTDILQHVLLFNHSEDIQTVSKTFNQCIDKNKNIFDKQEYLDFNVDKIESYDEALKMLNDKRKKKFDLVKKYDELQRQHEKALNESIDKIRALRENQFAMVKKKIYPLQTGIFNEKIKELSAKLRDLTPPIKQDEFSPEFSPELKHCTGCGKISDSFFLSLCRICDMELCDDCY